MSAGSTFLSIRSQGSNRIHARSSSRRNPRGGDRHTEQQQSGRSEIEHRWFVDGGRYSGQEIRSDDDDRKPDNDADPGDFEGGGDNGGSQPGTVRTKRHSNPDFARSLHDDLREHAEDPDRG